LREYLKTPLRVPYLVVQVANTQIPNTQTQGQTQTQEIINVDWNNNVHVIEFAYLAPVYTVKSYRLPNNAVIIIELSDSSYILIHTTDDGDFVETFENFDKLNDYLSENFGFKLNEPPNLVRLA
jgi:hypothetical protein